MLRCRSLVLGVLALITLCLCSVGQVPAQAQARPQAQSEQTASPPLRLKRAPVTSQQRPLAKETFTLTGTLGRSVRRPALLQKSRGTAWSTVRRTTLPASGRYRFKVSQSSPSLSWRVVAPALTKKAAAKTPKKTPRKTAKKPRHFPRRATAARLLALSTPSGTVTGAEAVIATRPTTVSAAFTPARPGRAVRFQIKRGAQWVDLATARQRSDGRVQTTWTAAAQGIELIRARTSAAHGASASATAPITITVLPADHVGISAHASNSWNELDAAIAAKPEWLETDFRASAVNPTDVVADPACAGPEGTRFWFLTHDETFAANTDVAQIFPERVHDRVNTFTCQEIQQLSLNGPKAGRPDTHGVLTLREFVAAVRTFEAAHSYSRERIMVEFKESQPDLFADFYDQAKAAAPDWIDARSHRDRAVFMSFAYQEAFAPLLDRDWKGGTARLDDGAELGAVMGSASAPLPDPETGVSTHWLQAHYAFPALSPAVVERARTVFDDIVAWTPTTLAQIRGSVMAGADIVTVNDVALAKVALLR